MEEMRLRNAALRGTIHTIDDTGSDQQVVLETHAGVTRTAQVHQQFGFASTAPADGAVSVVFALGGDESDLVALPPGNPQAARMGNVPEGDAIHYDASGQRVHLSNGQIVDIRAVKSATISIGDKVVLTVTAAGLQIEGDLSVNGKITATEDVIAGNVSLQNHRNTGVQAGSSNSGPPAT